MKKKELWDEDNERNNAQVLIDWLMSEKAEYGWSMHIVNSLAFLELCASSTDSDNMKEEMAMWVLTEMSKTGKTSVEEFEVIFQQLLKKRKSASRIGRRLWKIFIPLNVKLDSAIDYEPKIRILGKDLFFLRINSVKQQVDKDTKDALSDPQKIPANLKDIMQNIPETFMAVSTQSNSWEQAGQDVESALNALIGLIEITYNIHKWKYQVGSMRPREVINSPRWLIAYQDGLDSTLIRIPDAPQYPLDTPVEFNQGVLDLIQKNAQPLRDKTKTSSTISLIVNCLRLYSQAMSASTHYHSFLGFWQLVEALVLSNSSGGQSTEKLIKMIAWHGNRLGLKGSGFEYSLLKLSNKRNDLVHRGLHNISEDDVNLLKFACESALDWLFQIHRDLPTEAHLRAFYRYRTQNLAELEATKAAIAFIGKSRK